MPKARKEVKINQLLRLAELCSPEQEDRKNYYMDLIEQLLIDDVEGVIEEDTKTVLIPDEYTHLKKFYDEYENKIIDNLTSNIYVMYLEFCRNNKVKKPLSKQILGRRMCMYFDLCSDITHIYTEEGKYKTVRIWKRR